MNESSTMRLLLFKAVVDKLSIEEKNTQQAFTLMVFKTLFLYYNYLKFQIQTN